MPLFDLREVSYQYEDEVAALRSVTLAIEAGQKIALVGANGSGKSTLLRILDLLFAPSSGNMTFDGRAVTPRERLDERFNREFRRRVSLVFQNPDAQLFNPTVFDEVAFAPLQLRWTDEQVVSAVERVLTEMGIGDLRNRPPYRLSGGEKKKVALASVLVLDPEVLLLDEPTAALDPRSQSQLVDLIQNWKSTQKTVITATHQLDVLEDIADLVHVMQEGRVIASGTPQRILDDHDLLLRANLIHSHRHSHAGVVHSHPHSHRHAHKHDTGEDHEH